MSQGRQDSARPGLVRFLIVGCQRSGTTVTREAVLQHPQVSMLREELSADPLFTVGMRAFTHGRESYDERRRANLELFDAFAKLHAGPRTRAAGVKVALDSVDAAADLVNFLVEYLPGIRVVHVVREDLVAQFASFERAQRTKVWDARSRAQVVDEDVRLAPHRRKFEAYAVRTMAITAQLQRLAAWVPVLEVRYERDIDTPDPCWSRVFEFLGIDVVEPHWMRMRKVAPPVEDYVENIAKLRRVAARLAPPTESEVTRTATDRLRTHAATESPEVLARRHAALSQRDARELARAIAEVLTAAPSRPRSPRREIDEILRAAVLARVPDLIRNDGGTLPDWARALDGASASARRDAFERAAATLHDCPATTLLEIARLTLELEQWDAAVALCSVRLERGVSGRALTRGLFEVIAHALEACDDGDRARELVARFEHRYAASAALAVFEARAMIAVDRDRALAALDRAAQLQPDYPGLQEMRRVALGSPVDE